VPEHVPLYSSAYAGFGVREQVRHATYGDDVGQSGWVTADELERFADWLELGADSRLLDVGCGSGGPALRLAESTGASVVGVDVLEDIATATRLAEERGLADRVRFVRVDAGGRLPFADESFEAVIAIDVMCHLPNRLDILREWHHRTRGSNSFHRPHDRHRSRHRCRNRGPKRDWDLRLLGRVGKRDVACSRRIRSRPP
jgi:SAM-dependent methyltransferase